MKRNEEPYNIREKYMKKILYEYEERKSVMIENFTVVITKYFTKMQKSKMQNHRINEICIMEYQICRFLLCISSYTNIYYIIYI